MFFTVILQLCWTNTDKHTAGRWIDSACFFTQLASSQIPTNQNIRYGLIPLLSSCWLLLVVSHLIVNRILSWKGWGGMGVGHFWQCTQSILWSAISVIWQAHQSLLCSCVQSPRRTQSSLDGHESEAAVAIQISCSHRFLFDVFTCPQFRHRAAGVINLISPQNQNRQYWQVPASPVNATGAFWGGFKGHTKKGVFLPGILWVAAGSHDLHSSKQAAWHLTGTHTQTHTHTRSMITCLPRQQWCLGGCENPPVLKTATNIKSCAFIRLYMIRTIIQYSYVGFRLFFKHCDYPIIIVFQVWVLQIALGK